MNRIIHSKYENHLAYLDRVVQNFDSTGEEFGNQDRNSIKLFELEGNTINVKSFKVPNIVNQIAYRIFRKSKAQRSFEYANTLRKLNIGTPQPIAYYEFTTPFFLKKSFYLSEHLKVILRSHIKGCVTSPH